MTGDGGTKVFYSATCKKIEAGGRVSTLARRKRLTRVNKAERPLRDKARDRRKKGREREREGARKGGEGGGERNRKKRKRQGARKG